MSCHSWTTIGGDTRRSGRRRLHPLAGLAVLSVAIAASPAAAGGPTGKSPAGSSKTKTGKKTKKPPTNLGAKALATLIDRAEFEDMPLEDVLDWLGRQVKASVVVRWKAIEEAGVERDTTITLKREKITVRRLLPLIFDQAVIGVAEAELGAKADENMLIISTRKDLNSEMLVRTYSVEDLLMRVPDFEGSKLDLNDIGQRGSHPATGRVRGGGQIGTAKTDAEIGQGLIDLIMASVEPDSWKVNGGHGTITLFRKRLVIRNSLYVHQKIAGIMSGGPQVVGP